MKIPTELKGLGIALGMGITLCTLAAAVVYYSGIQETVLNTLGKAIMVSSVFTGGAVVAKAYGNQGLVRGSILGLMFFIVMLITTFLAQPTKIYIMGFIYTLTACLVAGALGGVLGVGLSEGK
ncbi:MAG: TIGR04086 family membrane protein [Syntrophomonadaceae bacterium]